MGPLETELIDGPSLGFRWETSVGWLGRRSLWAGPHASPEAVFAPGAVTERAGGGGVTGGTNAVGGFGIAIHGAGGGGGARRAGG